MQQTEKYGFKLIEMGDTFSTEPLNENMRLLEAELDKKGTCTVVADTFEGNGINGREIEVGFTPKFLFIFGSGICFVNESYATLVTSSSMLAVSVPFTETGFRLQSGNYVNKAGTNYRYVAFG